MARLHLESDGKHDRVEAVGTYENLLRLWSYLTMKLMRNIAGSEVYCEAVFEDFQDAFDVAKAYIMEGVKN